MLYELHCSQPPGGSQMFSFSSASGGAAAEGRPTLHFTVAGRNAAAASCGRKRKVGTPPDAMFPSHKTQTHARSEAASCLGRQNVGRISAPAALE